jgi:Tfp pilus assembly PilM family ATPase
VARGTEILFARTIPVGGDHFSRATANGLKIKLDEAKLLRVKLAQLGIVAAAASQPAAQAAPVAPKRQAPAEVPVPASDDQSIENSFALLPAGVREDRRRSELGPATAVAEAPVDAVAATPPAAAPGIDPVLGKQAKQVEEACKDSLNRLVEELELCRRYYETTFQDKPVQRLMFLGGEARQKALCQHIARAMGLAAQVGDPLPRLKRENDGEDGIECLDRKSQHPSWAVAIGLSIGPAAGSAAAAAAAAAAGSESK